MAVMLAKLFLAFASIALVSAAPCQFSAGGNTYDFSSLGLVPYMIRDRDLPSVFRYQLQFCQNLRTRCDELSGKSAIGNFYQMDGQGKQCYQVLSNWTNPLSVSSISKGISLMWHNGDICQGSPIITRMDITCNPNVPTINGTVVKNPSNSCEYIASLQSNLVCTSPPSGCVFSGKDLSPLKGQRIVVNDNNVAQQFSYYISFCGDLTIGCRNRITGQVTYGSFYQEQRYASNNMCYAVVAKWVRSQIKSTYSGGVLTMMFNNGEMCNGSPRSVTIYMTCKPGATVVTGYGTDNGCTYTAHLFSELAC